jgi:hypothetical protein
MKYEPWIGDTESYPNFWCCTLLSLKTDESRLFIIDENRNDAQQLIQAFKGINFIGYNNKSYDNLVINYIIKHPCCTSEQLFSFQSDVINAQRKDDLKEFFFKYGQYMYNDSYKYIDLMRMLFSKKLRVSLKELECSLNFKNVEDLPYEVGSILTEQQKTKVIEYNFNDCEATKEVANKSLPDIKLRKWTKDHFGVECYSLDGVNLGVKILGEMLARKIGSRDFLKTNTNRKIVFIKDILFPFIKFDTPAFQAVHEGFKKLKCVKYYDKKLGRERWNKIANDVRIGPYTFKYGIGGLHFETKTRSWKSNDEYDVLSVDVSSYYPTELIEYWEYCKPEHLPYDFIGVYKEVRDERLKAKAEGDEVKSETYKFSINGAFGNLANENSWLCDQKALMAITVNGQLMLSMLCEKLMQDNIVIIDANTDGIYVYLHKSQKERFKEICEEWQKTTRMVLEETKFEAMYFLTTADYFGTYYKKGKLEVKEKGCFITTPRLGKGMEFPIMYKAVKEYFLNQKDFTQYIKSCDNILDFCSYKKLKKNVTCYWKGEKQQKVNRFYASREGAHLFKKAWDDKRGKWQVGHILKDSPVILFNRIDNKPIEERGINYPFYISKAREMITALEGDKGQMSLF